MLRALLVGIAGAVGALSRYGIARVVGLQTFPWATLAINTAGSLVLGYILGGPAVDRWSPSVTTALTVGFLGAFTTFSTFAFEATSMLRAGRAPAALSYVAASVILGLAAAAAGYAVGRATL